MDILFQHLPQFRVIICKQCEYAVVPPHLHRHLRDHHKIIPAAKATEITGATWDLPDLAYTPADVRYPRPGESAIAGLPILRDGYQCTFRTCRYICQDLRSIKRHCRVAHAWTTPRRKGGQARGNVEAVNADQPWRPVGALQQFFRHPQWSRYFEVQLPSEPQDSTDAATGVAVLEQMHVEALRRIENTTITPITRLETNPWLDHTRWESHLRGLDRDRLSSAIQPADAGVTDPDELALELACKATRDVTRKALALCSSEDIGKAVLYYVSRRETGEKDNEKPFNANLKVVTVQRYIDTWTKLLRYVWRTSSWVPNSRPRYTLTAAQHASLQSLREASIGPSSTTRRETLQTTCLGFWISMFDHEYTHSEFESAIISGIAVLGFDTIRKAWTAPDRFTQRLSAIVTISRALVVYSAYTSRRQKIADLLALGQTEEEAEMSTSSIFLEVQAMVGRFMTLTEAGGRPTPMDRILHMRTYGMKVVFGTKGAARISWKGETIYIDKISLTMDDLRSLVHGLYETARTQLMGDLLFFDGEEFATEMPPALPKLDLDKLYDNAAQLAPYWNFLQDTRTSWEVDGEKWLWFRLQQGGEMQEHFLRCDLRRVTTRDQMQWNLQGVENWFRKVKAFKEILLVLVHLTAGAPARGTEILSTLHENSAMGRTQRSLFVDRGMVQLATSYHKGYSTVRREKLVHRFVPEEVGRLLVYYLWLVEPFVRQLLAMTKNQHNCSSFIWEPEPEREWVESDHDSEDRESTGASDSEHDVDADTRTTTEKKTSLNVDGFWNTDRLTNVLAKESSSRIGARITTSLWRHMYPAIQREFSPSEAVKATLGATYDLLGQTNLSDALEEQSGHTKRTEGMIYGISLSESPYHTVSQQDAFRKVSIDWHRFLRFPSACTGKHTALLSRARLLEERKEQEVARWKGIMQTDATRQLHKLLGSGASWRGIQQPGIAAIMGRHPRVLAIMRTGGGKSLLFMLPASCSRGGVTIVIVPLISLREDLRRRCEKVGLICAVWDGQRPPYQANIILVTPESAVSMSFSRFIDEKRTMRQLDRIVIDECHVVLDSTDKWRPEILQLPETAEKETQVVYLTATLPPAKETTFFDLMGLRKDEVLVYRDRTTRVNVAYRVRRYNAEREDEEVKNMVDSLRTQYPLPGQILVYCRKIQQVVRLADTLACPAFHRNVGTEREKARLLQRLVDGKEHVVVATNALGLGADIPSIRAVVHVGMQEKIADYAQESGRAGRDGLPSQAVIMLGYRTGTDGRLRLERGSKAEPTMQEFAEGMLCRRVVLDRELDGIQDRTGCTPGEETCDICTVQMPAPTVIVSERREPSLPTATSLAPFLPTLPLPTPSSPTPPSPTPSSPTPPSPTPSSPPPLLPLPSSPPPFLTDPTSAEERSAIVDTVDLTSNIGSSQHVRENLEDEEKAYTVMRWRRLEERAQARDAMDELRNMLDSWTDQCVICRAQGKTARDHIGWESCSDSGPLSVKVRSIVRFLGSIPMQDYSGCKFCRVPQRICHTWEDDPAGRRGAVRRRRGGTCQYVREFQSAAVACMLKLETDGDRWQELEDEFGLTEAMIASADAAKPWLGKKFNHGSMEMSGLCRLMLHVG